MKKFILSMDMVLSNSMLDKIVIYPSNYKDYNYYDLISTNLFVYSRIPIAEVDLESGELVRSKSRHIPLLWSNIFDSRDSLFPDFNSFRKIIIRDCVFERLRRGFGVITGGFRHKITYRGTGIYVDGKLAYSATDSPLKNIRMSYMYIECNKLFCVVVLSHNDKGYHESLWNKFKRLLGFISFGYCDSDAELYTAYLAFDIDNGEFLGMSTPVGRNNNKKHGDIIGNNADSWIARLVLLDKIF